ncbi:MAG: 2-oxoacid ferredoxin oxidoreductase [Syntrophorhabdus sp. PtaU1.Bin058]|nr:MAG: 2-oxoacid ferredoxin oxidoreductase [Syntrophorhabdus sp. PtaU1.Bin058]
MKIQKEVMIGNYAIARGFVEAGIDLAAAYPGTPSSEILPGIVEFKKRENMKIHTEWSTNERCALEVAFGAALNGKKTVCLMKQVGLNVAFPGLLKGRKKIVKGAFVIVSCDDPGPQSSQTEQDTRLLAVLYGIPVFDPASPTEAADIAYYAVQYSAEHRVPVIVRSTHRVSHAREPIPLYPVGKRKVMLQEGIQGRSSVVSRKSEVGKPLTPNASRLTALGVVASGMSCSIAMDVVEELGLAGVIPVYKVLQLSADSHQPSAADIPLSLRGAQRGGLSLRGAQRRGNLTNTNRIATAMPRDDNKGSAPDASRLTPYDLRNFIDSVDKVLILEETDMVIEALIGDAKKVFGRRNGYVPGSGELTYDIIRDVVIRVANETKAGKVQFVPDRTIEETLKTVWMQPRPPKLCAGCPHRASFYAMRYAFPEAVFPGDIGCYTLGIAQGAVDTCLDMGAGVTIASGFYDAYVQDGALIPIIASTGDSTFFHSCLAPLYDAVKKQKRFVLVIMDNGTTAMTGMQPTPQTGITADGSFTHAMKIEDVVRGLGVGFLRILDPYDIPLMISTIHEAYEYLSGQPDQQRQFDVPCSTFNVKTEQTKGASTECVIASPQGAAIPQSRSSRRFAPRDDSKVSNVEHRTLNIEQVLPPGPAVIIARRECILYAKEKRKDMLERVPIERDCIGCKSCLTLFDCPAMSFDDASNKIKIDEGLCVRCGMCLFACTMGKQGKGLFRFQDTYFIKNRI